MRSAALDGENAVDVVVARRGDAPASQRDPC